jgi:hypothetical protein
MTLHGNPPHLFPLLPPSSPLGPLALPVWLTRPELALFGAADRAREAKPEFPPDPD